MLLFLSGAVLAIFFWMRADVYGDVCVCGASADADADT